MNVRELYRVVQSSGWQCRMSGDEVTMASCYFCGNDRFNLDLSPDKGVFHCWACRRGGRLDGLLKSLTGQDYHIATSPRGKPAAAVRADIPSAVFAHEPISNVPSAAQYLAQRGIEATVAAQYGICLCTDPKHRIAFRIAIPMRDFWTNELLGWVGRSYTGAKPKYLSTMAARAITGWRIKNIRTPVVVVEGALDGIAVHRAGYTAAVLGGIGAADVAEWASRVPQETPVVIALDGDATAQATRLLWQIRAVRYGTPVEMLQLAPSEDPAGIGPVAMTAKVSELLAGVV